MVVGSLRGPVLPGWVWSSSTNSSGSRPYRATLFHRTDLSRFNLRYRPLSLWMKDDKPVRLSQCLQMTAVITVFPLSSRLM